MNYCVFFSNDAPTTEIYTLSLHDALPIFLKHIERAPEVITDVFGSPRYQESGGLDRKSTRLNSSHLGISYAVFCLKKKKVSTKMAEATAYRNTDASNARNVNTRATSRGLR